ncbi:MAG: hypothetical protein PUK67_00545 [Prevotellaceae bacterium]|nr:hypothetical protein [Prevotellaceae bacterium]MDY3365355.1 hypothetical protein [Prevotella sp.]
MMTKYRFYSLLLITLTSLLAMAQRKGGKVKNKVVKPAVEVITSGQKLYQSMLSSTAKVMFIDSMVVDKENFISHIPLSVEMGNIAHYSSFFQTEKGKEGGVYENELKTTRYFAIADSVSPQGILMSDKLGNEWSKPRRINEIGNEYQSANFPFLLPDGNTMFFAAKGEHSVGGYDIFVTKKNYDNGQFYQPENYGLPFNSSANEYLIAFDEINSLGYLVSDRYQENNKVCIYIFVPTAQRESLENEGMSDADLKKLADIKSIQDTWKFGDRVQALKRLERISNKNKSTEAAAAFRFVVNDSVIYTHLLQFSSPQSQQLFMELQKLEKEYVAYREDLDKMQGTIHQGSKQTKRQVLQYEEKMDDLQTRIQLLAKEIRNIENKSYR